MDTGDCGRIADRPRSSEGLEVGLTVPGRPRCRVGALIGSTADQQGRWSLPGRERRSRRLGVGGWRFDERHQVQSIQHSMLHSVLCLCLFQVGLTVPVGRVSRRRIDRVYGGPAGTLVPT